MNTRLDGLQSLRGIAAFAVLFQHVTYYCFNAKGDTYLRLLKFDLGSSGVYLFFVISGFVMAGCMSQGRSFIAHRALRIYPAFWLAIGVSYLLLHWNAPWTFDWLSVTLFPTPNLNGSYMIPYWTLIYEAAFYVVTYVIILTGRKHATNVCLVWLLAILAVSQYRNVSVTGPGLWVFFSKLDIFFIFGMLAALNRELVTKVPRVVLIIVAIAIWTIGQGLGQVSLMAYDMLMALSFTLIVALWADGLRSKALMKFGDMSFGVYLIHVPIAMLTIHLMTAARPDVGLGALWLVTFAAASTGATLFGMVEHRLYLALKKATRVRRPSAVTVAGARE